jgi:hypothetical protein
VPPKCLGGYADHGCAREIFPSSTEGSTTGLHNHAEGSPDGRLAWFYSATTTAILGLKWPGFTPPSTLCAIRVATREVRVLGVTEHADGNWVANVCSQATAFQEDFFEGATAVIMDRDPLFLKPPGSAFARSDARSSARHRKVHAATPSLNGSSAPPDARSDDGSFRSRSMPCSELFASTSVTTIISGPIRDSMAVRSLYPSTRHTQRTAGRSFAADYLGIRSTTTSERRPDLLDGTGWDAETESNQCVSSFLPFLPGGERGNRGRSPARSWLVVDQEGRMRNGSLFFSIGKMLSVPSWPPPGSGGHVGAGGYWR